MNNLRGQKKRQGKGISSYRLGNEKIECLIAQRGAFNELIDPANIEVYTPRVSQLIAKEGAWVMITRALPPMEENINEHFRVARVFYVNRLPSTDAEGFLLDGTYKVICHSPWGDVCLWPYEYATIDVRVVLELWQAGELIFHPTDMEAGRFNDIVFYARSRGIGLADAMVMALGTFQASIGWFEARPDLAEIAEEMEARVHRWQPQKRSRR